MGVPTSPQSPQPPPPPPPDYHYQEVPGPTSTQSQYYQPPVIPSSGTPTPPAPHDFSQVSQGYIPPPPAPKPAEPFKPYKPSSGKATPRSLWIVLLSLRSFTLVAALISFAIGASVSADLSSAVKLDSLGYIIAAMVILFLESAAFIVIAALQLLGPHLQGAAQRLVCLIALICDQVLLLLCFGASCAAAGVFALNCKGDSSNLCSRGNATAAMGFLASLAQFVIVGVATYLLHLLLTPAMEEKAANAV